MSVQRSRLAPSPTGALHIGNACSFLINWALARKNNWDLILRMEDLVGPRINLSSINDTQAILTWLGVDWDGEMVLQSEDLTPYQKGLDELISLSQAYHCNLSRKEIEQVASAPHKDDSLGRQTIRPVDIQLHNEQWNKQPTNWRFCVDDTTHILHDELLGEQQFEKLADFVIWTKNDTPAYQLAVVIDDARQGVTDVVRGHDLLESAAWQSQLYTALGFHEPKWWHVPLVIGEDGLRLAKRHGDTRLLTYYNKGMQPEKVIGLIAKWCNITKLHESISSSEFLQGFDIRQVSTEDIVFTKEDEQWLLA